MGRKVVRIEIKTLKTERFLNELWLLNIKVKKIRKENISTLYMDIYYEDYEKVRALAIDNNIPIKVVGRKGLEYHIFKFKNRKLLYLGMIMFLALVYYFSTYIWSIEISTGNLVSPYEIRSLLEEKGIKKGIKKSEVNIFDVERMLCAEHNEIIWAKVRTNGTQLKIKIAERQMPPNLEEDDTPCDLIATKDAVIESIYTKAGTAIVKEGDVVKKGDVLVEGKQGNEETSYEVHSEGKVLAKTYYEKIDEVKLNDIKRIRTGKYIENKYFLLFGKKIYLKNGLNNFAKYDKIEEMDSFIKKEYFYEVVEETIDEGNIEDVLKETEAKLYSDIVINFHKNIKILDTVKEHYMEDGIYKVRVLIVAQEEISVPKIRNEE